MTYEIKCIQVLLKICKFTSLSPPAQVNNAAAYVYAVVNELYILLNWFQMLCIESSLLQYGTLYFCPI